MRRFEENIKTLLDIKIGNSSCNLRGNFATVVQFDKSMISLNRLIKFAQ